MNLNGKTAALLEGLTEEKGVDLFPLQEAEHPAFVMKNCDAIRRFLGLPSTSGGIRPSSEFLAVLLGFGREGLLRLYAAYVEETARTTQEAGVVLDALATLCRKARADRLISWDLDGVGLDAAKGKPKILVAFPPETDARLRDAALARGETLTGFIVEAVRDRLARIESKPPLRRLTVEEGAAATAEAR